MASGRFSKPPGGAIRDINDQLRLRHARERHSGFPVGAYLQPPPMLFTRDGHNLFLGDLYRGHTAFLIGGGPSLTTHDLSLLKSPGVLTLAMNNAAVVARPNLWCSVDDPGNFCDGIWYDPGILKFVPLCHMEKHFNVRNNDGDLEKSKLCVGDMPGIIGYRRNEKFLAEQWLYEDTFNWGNHSKEKDAYGQKGSRSVMYVALRLLFYLGVRRVFLIGCDFKMEVGKQNYAFEQDRSPNSVRGNNSSYKIMNVRFANLLPSFEAEGFQVFNCTPKSGLEVFPYVDYEQAIESATAIVPEKIVTQGMYDRNAKEKKAKSPPKTDPIPDVKKVEADPQENLTAQRNGKPIKSIPPEDISLITFVRQDEEESLSLSTQNWHKSVRHIGDSQLFLGVHHPEKLTEFEIPGAWTQLPCGPDIDAKTFLRSALEDSVSTEWIIYLSPNTVSTCQRESLLPLEVSEGNAEMLFPRSQQNAMEFPWILMGRRNRILEWIKNLENVSKADETNSNDSGATRMEGHGWEQVQSQRMLRAFV